MDPKLVSVLVVGVITAMIGGSEAISCYQCDSILNSNCGDTFSSTGIRNCSSGRACLKSKGSLSDMSAVLRDCSLSQETSDKCYEESYEGYTATVCICLTNFCNDGPAVKPTHYKILFTVAMTTLVAISWMNHV